MNLIKFPFKYTSFFFLILSLYTSVYANSVTFFASFSSPIIQELVLPRHLCDEKIHDILSDSCENLFLTTQDNLWIISGNTWQNIRIPGLPEIAATSSGSVYVGSGNQVFRLSYEDNKFLLKEGSDVIPLPEKIRDLFVFNDQIFVVSENKITLIEEGNFRSVATVSGKTKYFTTRNAIILQDKNQIRKISKSLEISKACDLSFKVSRPLYLSGFAIFLYVLTGLACAFIIYRRIILYRNKVYTGEDELAEISDALREDVSQEPKKYVFHEGSHASGDKKNSRWDKYEMVTVLFSDIQGFTKIAEQMNPEKLIDELDQFFFHFDSVVEKYNIEKIKTIGDAYMAAGGIPLKNRSNPVEVVLAALEMQQFMKQMQKTRIDFWDLRIGIHTGPVIAGIVGHKKRSYDIWGDTVNTASRMESSGEAGKVNISGETYQYVKDYFICEYRGKLPVKYKGNLDMYFVRGLRPELSINLESLPNRKFYLKLQLLRLLDLEEFIFEKLEVELPKTLFFHTAEYARHLYHYAGLLSKAENLDMEENLLILTASLLLPVGYMENYLNPEAESSTFAMKILPAYHYSEKQIQNISNFILASKYPPEPKNLLEKIMVDIRLEYLGRADFIKMYKLLFLERNEYLENMEIRIWKEQQIRFLENFSYFTAGAKRLGEITFDKQIQRIQEDEWN